MLGTFIGSLKTKPKSTQKQILIKSEWDTKSDTIGSFLDPIRFNFSLMTNNHKVMAGTQKYRMGNIWHVNSLKNHQIGIDFNLNLTYLEMLQLQKKVDAVVGCVNRCILSQSQKVTFLFCFALIRLKIQANWCKKNPSTILASFSSYS